jgi:hypothetical protein
VSPARNVGDVRPCTPAQKGISEFRLLQDLRNLLIVVAQSIKSAHDHVWVLMDLDALLLADIDGVRAVSSWSTG